MPVVVDIAQWSRLQPSTIRLKCKLSWHQRVCFPLIHLHVVKVVKQCRSLHHASLHHVCKEVGRLSLCLLAR